MARPSADLAMWMLSAATGVLGVFILFTLGTPGLVVLFAPLLIAWTRSGGRGSLKVGGALAGFGATLLLILTAANARCAEFSVQRDQSCTAPDVTITSVAAAVVLVIGLALTFRVVLLRPT
jgi:hypothetical protein